MSKLCITTVVDNRYWDWVELFTWCCKKSYPEYDVKILKKEDYFPGYPDNGYTTNMLRFMTGRAPYEGYDYVYITDIDMMILPETPSLMEFHLSEMKKSGMCYSNSLRNGRHCFTNGVEKWSGTESFTGLHFCSIDWFDKTQSDVENMLIYLKTHEVGRGGDGRILWLMARDCKLGMPIKRKLLKRHHGIHVGTLRLFDKHKPLINRMELIKSPMGSHKAGVAVKKRIDGNKRKIWREYIQDPEYIKIVSRIKNPKIIELLRKLESFCGRK